MKTNSRQSAANTVKGAPKIGGLSMRVVENDGRGVKLLREPATPCPVPSKNRQMFNFSGLPNWENRSDLFSQFGTAFD